MFSVMTLVPSDTAISTIICACRSVGKPGYGNVATSVPRTPPVPGHPDASRPFRHARTGVPQLRGEGFEVSSPCILDQNVARR